MYGNKPLQPLVPKENYDKDKSMWTLSYRLKGAALGIIAIFIFCYLKVGYYPAKYIVAGGILGYFFGWVAGSFFYTKKQ